MICEAWWVCMAFWQMLQTRGGVLSAEGLVSCERKILQNSPAGWATGIHRSRHQRVDELTAEMVARQRGLHLPKAPLAQNPGAPICTSAYIYAIPVLHGSCSSNTSCLSGGEKHNSSPALDGHMCKSITSSGSTHSEGRLTPVEVIPCCNRNACRNRSSFRSVVADVSWPRCRGLLLVVWHP